MAGARVQRVWAWLAIGLSGCSIRVAGSAAKPTALERQLLGDYEELDQRLLHASSVRGSGANGPVPYEALKAQAIEQRAMQRFNEDDIAELKKAHCLAETLEATLASRPCPLTQTDPSAARRIARVVEEENRARRVLLTWAAHELARRQGRLVPEASEIRDVRRAYQRLLAEASAPGHLVEKEAGVFDEVRP